MREEVDEERDEKVREECCSSCPFNRNLHLVEVAEFLECFPYFDPSCEVLCHTDGFLEGQDYSKCKGFHENLQRFCLL